MKKLKLSVDAGQKPVDPLQIFQKLTLRGSIENIWEPQAEALREWNRQRNDPDVAIEMNTGGGKTLVGLLIARSLVNESKGRVLYVCPNNQLLEQTYDRAKEIGLSPATRYKKLWHEQADFDAGNTFCVTNYATVFTGKSVFRNDDIEALVFDDAHVAETTIRNQFTLKIPSEHKAFPQMLQLCRAHFAKSSKKSDFLDVVEKRSPSVIFVPMFVVWKHADEFRRILLDSGIEDKPETLFSWEHLKGHLNHCCIIVNGNGLEVTPVVPPISQLNFFQNSTRRVYLTATLPSRAAFARSFGVSHPTVIRPSGKSGDAQRLIAFILGLDDKAQREAAMSLVEKRKSCVISPSDRRARNWIPPAVIYDTNRGQEQINRFADSRDAEMLALAARYDGIDLPGDACRLLLLDGLPTGECLIDRFIDENIQIETIRNSHTATRVVQAIGRIFRSNTDHGVVLLVGSQLQSWVRIPKNRACLPELLQKQLLLGVELSKRVEQGETTWKELIDAVLTGDENWDETYEEYIDKFRASVETLSSDWHVELALEERKAFDLLWIGQFQQAADSYASLDERARNHDKRLAAWYRHWRGLALLCADDRQGALQEFVAAANVRAELGRPSEGGGTAFKSPAVSRIGLQARTLAEKYRKRKARLFDAARQVTTDLVYGSKTQRAEEALRMLGELIGLDAERPDKSRKTGPDVTWQGDGGPSAWGFELKTNKDSDGIYSKEDVSQCHDHKKWMSTNHGNDCELTIVGRMLAVSEIANPSSTLRVTEVDAFHDLLGRAKATLDAVESGDKNDLEQSFQSWLNYYGLNWPGCVEALDSKLAIDLRGEQVR